MNIAAVDFGHFSSLFSTAPSARRHFSIVSDQTASRTQALKLLQEFDDRFAATGAKVVIAKPMPDSSAATFVPFTYEPDAGGPTYTDTIFLQVEKDGVPRSEYALNISGKHEKVHRLQETPEAHATPFNEGSPIVMCVEDWVWSMVMTEGDAYATTAYLASLEETAHPERSAEIRDVMSAQPVTLQDWDHCMRLSNGDVQEAKQRVSTIWWNRIKNPDRGLSEQITLLNHYVRHALWLYEISDRLNPKYGHTPEEYVQLDREKMAHTIGNSFGPNTFGEHWVDPSFLKLPQIMPELEVWMNNLIQKQGGTRETKRSFYDALAARNLTEETYLAQSKANISWHVPANKRPQNIQPQHEEWRDKEPRHDAALAMA